MKTMTPNMKRVRSPNTGTGSRSPDIETRLVSGSFQLAANPSTGTKYPLLAIHPDYPIVVEGVEVVVTSVTNLTSIAIGIMELGFFDYVFMRDNSGVNTQPQTKWLDRTAEAKTLAGTSFAYIEQITDAVYVGMADKQFNGVRLDVDQAGIAANSVVDAEYWDGTAWTNLTETDGTAAGGDHAGQDGTMTFTMPSDWAAANLRDTFISTDSEFDELAGSSGEGIGGEAAQFNKRAFWIRIKATVVYNTVATIKSIKRVTDITNAVVDAVTASGITINEPYEMTINPDFKGSSGYDNKDGVAVGGGIGAYLYAYLIGSNTVTGMFNFALMVREDLMAVGVDRAFGAKPTSQPFKEMGW